MTSLVRCKVKAETSASQRQLTAEVFQVEGPKECLVDLRHREVTGLSPKERVSEAESCQESRTEVCSKPLQHLLVEVVPDQANQVRNRVALAVSRTPSHEALQGVCVPSQGGGRHCYM